MTIRATLIVAVVLFWLMGCTQSSEERIAEATAQMKIFAAELSEEIAADAKNDLNDVVDDLKEAEIDGETKARREWLLFKREAMGSIEVNHKIIIAYMDEVATDANKRQAKHVDKILALEKKHRALKAKLRAYKSNDKTAWEKFKSEFNHDREGLSEALKDLAADNVK